MLDNFIILWTVLSVVILGSCLCFCVAMIFVSIDEDVKIEKFKREEVENQNVDS